MGLGRCGSRSSAANEDIGDGSDLYADPGIKVLYAFGFFYRAIAEVLFQHRGSKAAFWRDVDPGMQFRRSSGIWSVSETPTRRSALVCVQSIAPPAW